METRSISALPDSVLRRIAAHLDIPAVNNWRTLVALVPDYTEKEANAFGQLANKKRPGSPSLALLHDLQSRGYTIGDLSRLAHNAKLGIIRDILNEHCTNVQGMGVSAKLPQGCSNIPLLPPPPIPPSIPPPIPPSIPPPIPPSIPPPTPPPPSIPPPTPIPPLPMLPEQSLLHAVPPAKSSGKEHLVHLPYRVLQDATEQFDQTPYDSKGGHKLGEGGFGEVFYCRTKLSGDQQEDLAVKVLNKVETNSNNGVKTKHYEDEVEILSSLFHECVLPLVGFSCDGPSLCLVYPLMPRGSLDRYIGDVCVLSPPQRMRIATDIARALAYIHHGIAHKVVLHRDVKSANILLTEEWRGRLGDFGVVRFQPSTDTVATTHVVGTLAYMSPECAQGQVTPAADVYAFGVVLYELLTGLPAERADDNGNDLLSAIEDNEDGPHSMILGDWKHLTEVWLLAEQCTQHQHRKRPTSDKVAKTLEELSQLD